jgi:hypothetical protein
MALHIDDLPAARNMLDTPAAKFVYVPVTCRRPLILLPCNPLRVCLIRNEPARQELCSDSIEHTGHY